MKSLLKGTNRSTEAGFAVSATFLGCFPGGSVVKNPPTNVGDAERQVQSWVWEDPPEEEMATHCGIFSWRIPWTEELGGLQAMGF